MAETDKKPMQQSASGSSEEVTLNSSMEKIKYSQTMNREQLQIMKWLKEVRFRKKLFGGVNEQDVWKKIEKLNEMYDAALTAERVRYDVLLGQARDPGGSSRQTGDPIKKETWDDE